MLWLQIQNWSIKNSTRPTAGGGRTPPRPKILSYSLFTCTPSKMGFDLHFWHSFQIHHAKRTQSTNIYISCGSFSASSDIAIPQFLWRAGFKCSTHTPFSLNILMWLENMLRSLTTHLNQAIESYNQTVWSMIILHLENKFEKKNSKIFPGVQKHTSISAVGSCINHPSLFVTIFTLSREQIEDSHDIWCIEDSAVIIL